MQELYVDLLTPMKLMSKEEGRIILDLLCNIYPDLTPERYGNYEPLRQVFDPSHPEEALNSWNREFLWKRKRPKMAGGVWTAWRPRPLHGWLTLTIETKRVDIDLLIAFLDQAMIRLKADYGFIHLATAEAQAIGGASNTMPSFDPQQGGDSLLITTHQLVKKLPDLYWTTVFGPAYVTFFGRERLLSCPAPMISELEGGAIHLQLSQSPFDLTSHYEEVDAIRRQVKQHLNHNAFFDPTLPVSHLYDIPDFHLG